MDPSSADTSPDSDSEVKAADPMAEAEREAAALATPVRPLGEPGPRFDRRSPFFIGLSAAAGVAVTYAVIEVLLAARGMLILIVVALFLAVGIEPMIVWLERRHFRRWIAVTVVLLGIAVMLALFLVAAITPLVEQGRQFASHAPELLTRSKPPSKIFCRTSSSRYFVGKQTTLRATIGLPPIANTSLIELAAAICPQVKGSSTTGVMKSTVKIP